MSQPVISLIALREARNMMRSKAMIVTALLLLLVSIGGPLIAKFAMEKDAKDYQIGIVADEVPAWAAMAGGQDAATHHNPLKFRTYSTVEAGKQAVTDGDIDIALEPLDATRPYAYRAYTPNQPNIQLNYMVQGLLQQAATAEVLAQSNVNPQELAAASQAATLDVTSVKGSQQDVAISYVVALVGVILIVAFVTLFGQIMGQGVVEEKSSRVIEVIMGTVRPIQLLWGKILGIGAVAFGYMLLALVGAGLSLHYTDILPESIRPQLMTQLPLLLVCMLLAYFFFGSLYAATGAMVSRAEDYGTTASPLIILTMALYMLPGFAMMLSDEPFYQVLSWIPPFSLTLLPIQVAFDNANTLQIVMTILLNMAATALVVWLASRIYRRSILNVGSKVKWRDALGIPTRRK